MSNSNKLTKHKAHVAFFLSVDSFEGFYGGIFGLSREAFISSYRNDFVWEYAEGLKKLGHDITLYILSYGKAELCRISEGLSVRFIPLPKWLRLVDPFTYRLRNVPACRTWRDNVAYRGYGKAFQNALRTDRIEVLYHQEIWTPRFDVIARRCSLPVVGAEHGAVYENWMESAKRGSVPRAAYLTCQSQEAIDRCGLFGGRSELLCNGIDTAFFVPPTRRGAGRKVILTVGRLVEEQKRFTDLIKAMVLLPEHTLLIVGSGPAEAKLRQAAFQLGVSERVTFLGFVSDREELKRLYQTSDVFVSCSAWEAVALVVLEAMSCEMPVVCTRIPSFVELLEDGINGILIPVGSPSAIATAVLEASEGAGKLGPNARQTVIARYSSDVLYKTLSSLLQSVAEGLSATWRAETTAICPPTSAFEGFKRLPESSAREVSFSQNN